MCKKIGRLPALVLALVMVLTACGQSNTPDHTTQPDTPQPQQTQTFTLTACVGQAQNSLDPAKNTSQGGETILLHLFENLLKWVDDGDGFAVLAPGQAESWAVETDYAGNATYTFSLREGLSWSDGQAVTAGDFVYAWQRLADPATKSPHSRLLRMVEGYEQVQSTGDASLLAVSAPDERTFVVTLSGSCAWFLEEVCAGAYTMPVRSGQSAGSAVTNGPYTVKYFGSSLVELEKSGTYYDRRCVSAQRLRFVTATDTDSDYAAFCGGDTHLLSGLPESALSVSSDAANWLTGSSTASFAVLFNTLHPPFDSATVRQAFQLAIDPQAVVQAIGSVTNTPAAGLVPAGVSDYSPRPEKEEQEENVLPDPNAEPAEEEPAVRWDFRVHSTQLVTQPEGADYASSCQRARALMGQAGYAEGGGFPVVEYLYLESDENRAAALALQEMWGQVLGVTVTVRGVSREEYDDALASPAGEAGAPAPYQLVGMDFAASRFDAEPYLAMWHSAEESNLTGYHSSAFDILLDSARAAEDALARDAYLHDAEAILLEDAAVIPLYFRGYSYQLSSSLTGLYTAPNGVFFLTGVEKVQANS